MVFLYRARDVHYQQWKSRGEKMVVFQCLNLTKETWNNSLNGFKGSKGGAVVRALASHQCGPGSNPGVNAICGLSLLLVLSLAPRGFSGYSGFLLSLRPNTSKFQFDLESGHLSTSPHEVLSAPWVNKLQQFKNVFFFCENEIVCDFLLW